MNIYSIPLAYFDKMHFVKLNRTLIQIFFPHIFFTSIQNFFFHLAFVCVCVCVFVAGSVFIRPSHTLFLLSSFTLFLVFCFLFVVVVLSAFRLCVHLSLRLFRFRFSLVRSFHINFGTCCRRS